MRQSQPTIWTIQNSNWNRGKKILLGPAEHANLLASWWECPVSIQNLAISYLNVPRNT